MSTNLLVIIIAGSVFILIALLYRNATLDKLPSLSGERVIFEESGVMVEQSASPRSVIFINCLIRITDRRIIIAQKMLLSKKYALRHVILFNGQSDKTDLKTSLKKGYLNLEISRSDLKIEQSGDIYTIRINIPETVLTRNQYISYKTSGKEYYLNL